MRCRFHNVVLVGLATTFSWGGNGMKLSTTKSMQSLEDSDYNELLDAVVGTASRAAVLESSLLEFRRSRVLEKIDRLAGGAQNLIRLSNSEVLLAHDAALLHQKGAGRLAEVHTALLREGFYLDAVLAHHSFYRHDSSRSLSPTPPAKMRKPSRMPNIHICMTTIPRRLDTEQGIAGLKTSLTSLLKAQDYKASKVIAYLSVPQGKSMREGDSYPVEEAARLAKLFKGRLVVIPLQRDVGPGSRYVGCAKFLKQPSEIVMAFDDDLEYEPHAIRTLACALQHEPNNSWTGHGYTPFQSYFVGQGADGMAMKVEDLQGYPNLLDNIGRDCFKVDDVSISYHLTSIGRPVRSLEDFQWNETTCGLGNQKVDTQPLPLYRRNCSNIIENHRKTADSHDWFRTTPRTASAVDERDLFKDDTSSTKNFTRCRPTIIGVDGLMNDRRSGGRGADMNRCRDALSRIPGAAATLGHARHLPTRALP